MSFKDNAVALALVTTIATPAPAWALGGFGCTDLPEIYRAQGALEGMTSACDMTIEQARRIVAAQDGPTAVYQRVAPAPLAHRRGHRVRTPQP